MPEAAVLWWWAFAVAVAGAVLVTPLAPTAAEDLRVSVCRSTGGSCGYVPPRTRCEVLSRDAGVASAVTALRVSGSDGRRVTKLLDGTATVTVRDPAGLDVAAVAAQRLGARVGSAGGGRSVSDGIEVSYRFARHDDADAWLDHYHRVDVPVASAAAGARQGLHEGVRLLLRGLGFADLDALGPPDGVTVTVPVQALGDAAFGQASSSSSGAPAPSTAPTRLTLDVDGRSSSSGRLPAASNQDELARSLPQRVGLAGAATYDVTSDAAGQPVLLVLSGAAAVDADGQPVAPQRFPRLQEGGASRSASQSGAVQTLVLDLRGSANRQAFDRVFRVAGPTVTARSRPVVTSAAGTVAPDISAQATAVGLLARRLADDAVYVRTTARTRGSETTLLDGFSQDLAVPASRLTAMPGCAR